MPLGVRRRAGRPGRARQRPPGLPLPSGGGWGEGARRADQRLEAAAACLLARPHRRSPAVWVSPKPGQKKPLISAVGAGPIKVIPPYSWGSQRSRLVDILRKGHYDVKLDKEGLDRIVTWIDLNTPYYPTHATYYRTHTFGRCPLDHKQLGRLGALVRSAPGGAVGARHCLARGRRVRRPYAVRDLSRLVMTRGSPINFTRPQHSLCLAAFNDRNATNYRDALRIIQAGKAMLEQHPRADMPGFQPCDADRQRLERRRLYQRAARVSR